MDTTLAIVLIIAWSIGGAGIMYLALRAHERRAARRDAALLAAIRAALAGDAAPSLRFEHDADGTGASLGRRWLEHVLGASRAGAPPGDSSSDDDTPPPPGQRAPILPPRR